MNLTTLAGTFWVTKLPSGRLQYKCPGCQCNVADPHRHVPGSDDCEEARIERLRSISE